MTGSPDTPSAGTPEALGLGTALASAGLNVAGSMTPDEYDALVPEAWKTRVLLPTAATVAIVGSGGSDFYLCAREARPASEHPLDEHCEALMARVVNQLEAQGAASRALFYWQRLGGGAGVFADFVGLARGAGLGAPSRLGLLLHPHYGPWFAIRAVLLTETKLDHAPRDGRGFDPCPGCDAPCVAACHGSAVHGRSLFDGDRCAKTRHSDSRCADRCDARLACPVGSEHRYDAAALAHHMTSHFRSLP